MAGKKRRKKEFDIFYILDAITNTKEDVTNNPLFDKIYNIFMINRWLSMNSHTLMAALISNQIRHVSKKQHFYFLQNLIKKKKVYFRYKKGNKKDKKIDLIMKYYNVSDEKAQDIFAILDKKQITKIKNAFGGRKGRK